MLGSQRRRARRRLTDDESNELAEMLDAHLDREPVGREREEAVEQAWRDAKDQDELTFN
jgi:Na+/phosphate symporter